MGRVRSWCAAAEVRVSRRTRQLAAEGRSESAAALLSDNGRCSSKDAHTASERETICGVMPSFEDALAAGAVSAAHVDAPAAATRNLNDQLLAEFVACEADLLTDAGNQGVDVFERGCRELARHIAAQARANADADELDEQRRNSSVKQWTAVTAKFSMSVKACGLRPRRNVRRYVRCIARVAIPDVGRSLMTARCTTSSSSETAARLRSTTFCHYVRSIITWSTKAAGD